MSEFYCPLAKKYVEFVGEGQPVDDAKEITQLWTCSGCRFFVLYPTLIMIHVLRGKFVVDSCSAAKIL